MPPGLPAAVFDFWGTTVKVHAESVELATRLDYYFADFATAATTSDYEAVLSDAVLQAPDPTAARRWFLRRSGNAWSSGGAASHRLDASPLPPFALEPLVSEVATLHASAVAPPSEPGRALVILGPSTVGKTSILLTLLERGWHFITDDTLVVRRSEPMILRYRRPIGIRERNLDVFPWVREHLGHALTFETPTGTTYCVRPEDLPVAMGPEETRWTWTVDLHPASTFATARIGEQTWRIECDIVEHLKQTVDWIHESVLPKGTVQREV